MRGECKKVPKYSKNKDKQFPTPLTSLNDRCMHTLWLSFVVEVSDVAYLGHLSVPDRSAEWLLKIALFVSEGGGSRHVYMRANIIQEEVASPSPFRTYKEH